MRSVVINLDRRPDRLQEFRLNIEPTLQSLGYDLEIQKAIDGQNIDLESIRPRVHEWNFQYLNDKTLRGVIGCCLSHLQCYEQLVNSKDDFLLIFEDDCIPINSGLLKDLIFPLPEKFGIVYLNEYIPVVKGECEYNHLDKIKSASQTTESYIISREYAKLLYEMCINNIGAIDACMSHAITTYTELPCYILKNPLFIQKNRRDSDIQTFKHK